MTEYIAAMAHPGYLPWDDESPRFESTSDAWAYLADERRNQEEMTDDEEWDEEWSETVDTLDAWASESHEPDVLYGQDPNAGHGVQVAYSVTETE
jgi:hypothetical protein